MEIVFNEVRFLHSPYLGDIQDFMAQSRFFRNLLKYIYMFFSETSLPVCNQNHLPIISLWETLPKQQWGGEADKSKCQHSFWVLQGEPGGPWLPWQTSRSLCASVASNLKQRATPTPPDEVI